MKTPEKWKPVSSKEIADCRVFNIRENLCLSSENSKEASFFTIECANWVNVIPIAKQGEIVLIEQYRHGIQEIALEIPGGMIDDGEMPLETAKRELAEETGYLSDNIVKIGQSRPNPAIQNNCMHHFLATNCKLSGETNFDEHESIVTRLAPVEQVSNLIKSGKITHSLVIAAFYFAGDLGEI